jgi:putative acetyltransferase
MFVLLSILLQIRGETSEDVASIHRGNTEAFGREAEAVLVDKMRERGVLTISLVAVNDNTIIGHIAFSPVEITSEQTSLDGLTLAPVAVLPTNQNRGVGSRLVRAGLDECRKQGHEIVFLVGHPKYYPRFGFVPARAKGFECEYEAPDEAWMVIELKEGALVGKQGKVTFQPEFKEVVYNA